MGKKTVLVVEDDNFFREAISDILKKKYHVLEAPNGKVATEILSMSDVDLVLSDIQMPGMTGIELLDWSRKNKPVAFVVMTSFSMVLETQTAFELGAAGFIAKPFKNAELISVVDGLLQASTAVTPAPEKQEFCKVSIDEFVSKARIEFDVYIRLSAAKVVKLAHRGEEIPKDRVKHYKDKGVKHLHILKEDFSKLVNFNMNVTKIIKDRTDISQEKN